MVELREERQWKEKAKHYCSRNLWGTYGEHMGSPCDPHMFPICSTYGENFKNNQIICGPYVV